MLAAVVDQRLVDELAGVVRIDAAQRERHRSPEAVERIDDQCALTNQESDALGPATGHVGERQRMRVAPADVVAAMGDEVDLEKAGLGLLPVAGGTDRNTPGRSRPSSRPTSSSASGRTPCREQPVDRRCTRGEQTLTYHGVEGQVTMALQRCDQSRQQRLEALPADTVRGLPEHPEDLANRLTVDSLTRRSRNLLRVGRRARAQDGSRA